MSSVLFKVLIVIVTSSPENGAFFVTTNVVITPNQTWGRCPEDPESVPESVCLVTDRKTNKSQDCSHNYDSNLSKGLLQTT